MKVRKEKSNVSSWPKVYFSLTAMLFHSSYHWNDVWKYTDISSFRKHASCVLFGEKWESLQELALINENVLVTLCY
jgi:hypothetical protein